MNHATEPDPAIGGNGAPTPTLRKRASDLRLRGTRIVRAHGADRRALPEFLIIGAQKAGTTSLFSYLSQSPDVRVPLVKEVHFFDLEYQRGPSWYRTNFPVRGPKDDWRTYEASPFYLLHPLAPARARQTVPEAKIICILRDPVSRAASHWRHEVRRGTETLTFESALEAEDARTSDDWRRLEADPDAASVALRRYSYFRRGLYRPQLERWSECFDPDQTLVLEHGEFTRDPRAATTQVCTFLDIAPPPADTDYRRYNVGSGTLVDPSTAADLAKRYHDENLDLFEYLGRSYAWQGVSDS